MKKSLKSAHISVIGDAPAADGGESVILSLFFFLNWLYLCNHGVLSRRFFANVVHQEILHRNREKPT